MDEISQAKRRYNVILDRIEATRNLTDGRAKKRQRHLVREVLQNADLRLCCAFSAVRAAGKLANYPPSRIRKLARNLNPFGRLREPVLTWIENKDGKDRRLFSFGPIARSRQLLVGAVLEAIHSPYQNQFTLEGGVPAALGAVERAIQEGYRFGKEVDIRDFYPNIRLTGLYALLSPLPGKVITNTVWQTEDVPLVERGRPQGAHAVRSLPTRGLRGLSQGSACSNIAAEMIMASILCELPPGIRTIGYGDNVMILGMSEEDVEQGARALGALLIEHPCGPLVLKESSRPIYDLRQERFVFLKHEGEAWETADQPLRVVWEPDYARLSEVEAEIESGGSTPHSLRQTIRRVEGWRGGYPSWGNYGSWAPLRLAQLKVKLACMVDGIEMRALATQAALHWREAGLHVPLMEIMAVSQWVERDDVRSALLLRTTHFNTITSNVRRIAYVGPALLRRTGLSSA